MIQISKKTKRIFLKAVRLYQRTLSPDHGVFAYRHPLGYCRYAPTCSDYMYQAVERYGLIKGFVRGIMRIIRCNPFSRGGYDPLA